MTNYEIFHQLHYQDKPLIIGNAWNAYSAQLLEKNGFKAIATSSGAVAATLGFDDGQQITFDDLLFVVKKMIASIKVPISVDLEAGYGSTTNEIVRNIERLHEVGVVGINLEDSLLIDGKQQMQSTEAFSKRLNDIKTQLAKKNIQFFINARTDAFLLKLPSPLEITLERIKSYQDAGADGIFVLFAKEESDIKKITAATSLPVNVVSIPGLPSFEKLSSWGVRRVSLGSALFRAVYKNADATIKNLVRDQSVDGLFA